MKRAARLERPFSWGDEDDHLVGAIRSLFFGEFFARGGRVQGLREEADHVVADGALIIGRGFGDGGFEPFRQADGEQVILWTALAFGCGSFFHGERLL